MHGGRLSAAEKGKQKAADADDLPPALVLESRAGEPRRPAGDAAAANWHAGGSGVPLPRHLLGPPCGTSEIEEAPPSPPPAPSRPRLPALNAEDAAVAAGLAAVAGLEGRVMELQAALDSWLRELEEAKRRREEFWKPVMPVPQRNKSKRMACLANISRDSNGSTSGTSS
ncbi:uncharacterized protein [Miscanthus floridulus]|uniref:uncharacterized protein n=1 Tax=Miscanthus floridulus TaxID=154761 RepID=UPI003457848E